MTLPKETIDKINQQAACYSGYDENEDHTPISKGKYYGYHAGATEWTGKARELVEALAQLRIWIYECEGDGGRLNLDAAILKIEKTLKSYESKCKEVTNG